MTSALSYVRSVFFTVLILYGIFYISTDLWFGFLPFGVLPTLVLLLAIQLLKIPRPGKAAVEGILGKDLNEEPNDNGALIRTVAHRGAGLDAPENSLIAFRRCAEKGCNFIEFDVTLTKDGVPIIFHDDKLERMANLDWNISETLWKDLKTVDISVNHPYRDRFVGTNIPTLEEAVEQMLDSKMKMFIDLKGYDIRLVKVILDLFKKYPDLHKSAIISGFVPYLIYMIRRANPKIVCSLAYRPYYFTHMSYSYPNGFGPKRTKSMLRNVVGELLNQVHGWLLPRITYYFLGLSFILLQKDYASPDEIMAWRNKGVRVMVWTVNLPLEKQYYTRVLKCGYLTDTLVGESSAHLVDKSI